MLFLTLAVSVARGHYVCLSRQGISGTETDLRRQGTLAKTDTPARRLLPFNSLALLWSDICVLPSLSSKSSPQLCCCRFKLCIRKDMQSLQMIADKEYYSKARMKPLASQYIYVFELSFLCSRPDFGFCKKCDAALLPKENTEPDEFPAARPGAAFGVVGPAQICGVMGRRIDMITYPYRLAAPPGSTATQLNPLSTRAELKHSSSPRSILSKQGGFVSHEGRCIPLRPCQRKHYYCLPMPLEKKKKIYPICILF